MASPFLGQGSQTPCGFSFRVRPPHVSWDAGGEAVGVSTRVTQFSAKTTQETLLPTFRKQQVRAGPVRAHSPLRWPKPSLIPKQLEPPHTLYPPLTPQAYSPHPTAHSVLGFTTGQTDGDASRPADASPPVNPPTPEVPRLSHPTTRSHPQATTHPQVRLIPPSELTTGLSGRS